LSSPRSRERHLTDPRARLETALSDRYQIEREVGQGGMATVYLAKDLRHDRRVAVKVLRPELAAVIGAERFLQEIKLTANLQHAHILPLHDSGAVDGVLYYVMPFVDGETLRAKLTREKQLEIGEAVEFARQVASALDYAHRRSIIHRDIKPENVLIHDRQALVADFGIALAVSMAGGNTRMTETGMSLGTPQYMSPEQAMGDRELDARSDIYSLGAMLFEMLAGDPPYTGSTAQAIVAKVITEKAPVVTTHRDTVPPNVAAAVHKALAKLPADRFHSAADFAEALSNLSFTTPATQAIRAASLARPSGWRRVLWPAIATLFGGLAAWAMLRPAPSVPKPVARYGLLFPKEQTPVNHAWATFGLAPDGSWLAYVGPPATQAGEGREQLWIKPRDRLEASPLPGTADAWNPTASPDGQWLAFQAGNQLRKVPVTGGSPITLADSLGTANQVAFAWGDDGIISYADSRFRLRRVSGGGGTASIAWTPPTARFAVLPTALPKGRGVLFTLCDLGCRQVQEVWVLDLRSGQAKLLIPGAVRAWYAIQGYLVYIRQDGGVFAAPFDLGSLSSEGAAIPVLEKVLVSGNSVPQFTLSPSGTVIYFSGEGGNTSLSEAAWVGRDGRATSVDSTWRFDAVGNAGWALSPDGKRLAIKLNTEAGQHIWVKQLDNGPLSRLTFDSAVHQRPRWLPDGQTVSYVAVKPGAPAQNLYTRRGDGTGPEATRLALDRAVWEAVWSRDSKWLVLRTGGIVGAQGARDVFVMQLGVDSVPRPLLITSADEKAVALSPDSRWLAYESNETGRNEIYVRPFPNVEGGKWQVSTNGGVAPLWGHSGRELFYLDLTNQMIAAQLTASPSFSVTDRRMLFKLGPEYLLSSNYTPFDVSPDDRRFLLIRERGTSQSQAPPLVVIENWFEELKAKTRQ
jgi:eukaryotic-like serine/threonine-protein kinase